jgi:hypothetical protein
MKYTWTDRLQDWRHRIDWGDVALWTFIAAMVALVIGFLIAGPGQAEPAYSVPASLCVERPTGRTREELSHYQCIAYDEKMNCTVQMPVFQTQHEQEVTCRPFTTWR